jgi:hypothetical protein
MSKTTFNTTKDPIMSIAFVGLAGVAYYGTPFFSEMSWLQLFHNSPLVAITAAAVIVSSIILAFTCIV